MASKRVNLKNGRAAAVGVCGKDRRDTCRACVYSPSNSTSQPVGCGLCLKLGGCKAALQDVCVFAGTQFYAVLARGIPLTNNRNENVNKARMQWNP
jgi:hypothetical protein